MRKLSIIIIIVFAGLFVAEAQIELKSKLDEADQAYNSGNYEEARFALQQSLAELDKVVGEAIIKLLPTEVSGVPAEVESDQMNGGTAGISGVYVNRQYADAEKTVNLEIIANSPFLSMVNAAITNPLLASMSGGNQKIVKIGGYKSLVEKSEASDVEEYNIKIPISDSMITLECRGFSQSESIAIGNSLNIKDIASLISSGQ